MNKRFVIASAAKQSMAKKILRDCFERKALAMTFFVLILLPFFSFSQTSEKSLNKQDWQFHKVGDKQWNTATVPGTVHTDLFDNKLIPDPFYGDNEKQLQWIENEDWEYETPFNISKQELNQQHIELQFVGLDTYATVFLNDSLILSADNMFRSWNVDVKGFVHKGRNKLRIVFASAVKKGKEEAKKLPYTLPGDEKVFTRKAQYQYGWDFGPRFVTCGIYKDVKLVFWNNAKIQNVQCVQKSLTDSLAELEFNCEIKSDVDGDFLLSANHTLTETGPDWSSTSNNIDETLIKLIKGNNIYSLKLSIKNPHLWWSNGLVEAYLYPFLIRLSDKKTIVDTS